MKITFYKSPCGEKQIIEVDKDVFKNKKLYEFIEDSDVKISMDVLNGDEIWYADFGESDEDDEPMEEIYINFNKKSTEDCLEILLKNKIK